MDQAYVVPPDGGRLLDLGTFQAVVLAEGGQSQDQFTLLRTQQEPPGFGPPLHIHHDAAEAFYVLAGDYVMFLDGREVDCPAGSFAYVPAGMAHTFQVVSETPGTKLNLFSPAAMLGFFEGLAAAEADGTATDEVVGAIAAEHQMEVVGPVPEAYLQGPR